MPLYTRKFDEAGVHPDDIRSLSDVAKLPFTTKADAAAAEGRFVHVYVDNTDPARPVTGLPDEVRAAVEPLLRS